MKVAGLYTSVIIMLFLTSYISCGLGNCRGISVSANHLNAISLSLSSALLKLSLKAFPVHSVMLSSHVLHCLPLFLFPCRIVLASSDDLVTCPYYLSFRQMHKTSMSPCFAYIQYVLALLSLYSSDKYNQDLPQQTVKHRDLIQQNLAVSVIKKSYTKFIKIILSIICHIFLFLPFPLSRCMSLLWKKKPTYQILVKKLYKHPQGKRKRSKGTISFLSQMCWVVAQYVPFIWNRLWINHICMIWINIFHLKKK